MLFQRTLDVLALQATRRLSRYRAVTVLSIYAIVALCIGLVSYMLTFGAVLYPLASLLFSMTGRVQARYSPRSSEQPRGMLPYIYGASPMNSREEEEKRRKFVNYGSLPMRRPEADLLMSYLKPTDTYLEYGASGTTLAFPMLVQSSYAIEHDVQVCKGIAMEMEKHDALAARLRAFCAPVPVGRAGWGVVSQFEEGSYRAFHNYVDFPRTNLSAVTFDKVLINGRARVACALRILPQLRASSVVFLHDFTVRAEHYAAVLTYYDEVARVLAHGPVRGYSDEAMGLAVLRPRREYVETGATEVSAARVNGIYDAYDEVEPTEAAASAATAFRHGWMRTEEGGVDYYALARQMASETSGARVMLDVVMIPFIVMTYMALRGVFHKVFVEALSGGGRGSRLLAGDMRAAVGWGLRSNSAPAKTHASQLPMAVAKLGSAAATGPGSGKAE